MLKRTAFTLFELIIVVALIGIIYSLVLSNFHTKKDIKVSKLQDLKQSLLPLWKDGKRVELIIYNNYKDVILSTNGDINESYKPDIKISEFKDVEAYNIDQYGEIKKVEFAPIISQDGDTKKVDLKFCIYPNGSSSHYILKRGNEYFVFYPYFEDINITYDEQSAKEAYTHKRFLGVSIDEINE